MKYAKSTRDLSRSGPFVPVVKKKDGSTRKTPTPRQRCIDWVAENGAPKSVRQLAEGTGLSQTTASLFFPEFVYKHSKTV